MGIATILVDRGLLSREQLEMALAEQKATGERLDHALVRLGMVRPADVTRAIGEQFDMPIVDLSEIDVDEQVLQSIPAQIVFKQMCVPVARRGGEHGTLRVATSDPFELTVFDELRLLTGCNIELVLAEEDELRRFISRHYGVGGDTLDALSRDANGVSIAADQGVETSDEAEQAQEASVVKLVNELIYEAISSRATDVHIEPYEHQLMVRYRIDGMLQRASVAPSINRFAAAIVSRIKIMANLNIAEKRKPQDGRISVRYKGESYDLRISVIPMLFGEGVVMRILNKTTALLQLSDLGMPDNVLNVWDKLISLPHGILLVTGPTGSGKSTTLYASLNRIVSEEMKLITVEDPVEYHLGGINQIQVNGKVGLTFAAGLRSILRHDPDVIMIGEIRDRETAEAAVQASLTGHLVFSTLHTNDAPGALPRLVDMGVEPYLVASSIEGVMAQRLVRRVCAECAEDYVPDESELPADFERVADEQLRRGVGCRACLNTGYRGRIGVYEMLRMTDTIREMVTQSASAVRLSHAALDEGELSPLRYDCYTKARAGVTTIAEAMRVAKS